MSETRVDPTLRNLVHIVGTRQTRPNLPSTGCPFCVGGREAPDPYDVRWFPNRWPAMEGDRCEVVLYTPEHDATFSSLGVPTSALPPCTGMWSRSRNPWEICRASGVTFPVPARFRTVRWFGRGPHENYPERRAAAMLGVWESEPDESPYLVPQEFGLRTDCRWFELRDPERDDVMRIEAVEPASLHMSAIWHTDDDLVAATTATELTRRDHLIVNIDVAHRGLGTASWA